MELDSRREVHARDPMTTSRRPLEMRRIDMNTMLASACGEVD